MTRILLQTDSSSVHNTGYGRLALLCFFCSLCYARSELMHSKRAESFWARSQMRRDWRVPGAKITLTSTERGLSQLQTTNKSGEYIFNSLSVGTYNLTISAPTFATVNGANLIVESGGSVRFESEAHSRKC